MSINVTVTGNPVSIKRGKMVTADSNYGKNEFEKRRLMRLEQVRQQSKDIAETVRNRVRNEKRKQIKQIEGEGKEKLKNWQNRKLLELQTQYKEALEEIGVGHKEAETLIYENEIADDLREQKQQISLQRGRDAEAKLQSQKNQEYLQKSIPIQRKKIIRDIENSRAALISGIKQTVPVTKKRKPSASINITVPESDSVSPSENGSEASITNGNSSKNKHDADTSSCLCSEESEKASSNEFNLNIPKDTATRSYQHELLKQKISPVPTIPTYSQDIKSGNSPIDTRISDRIKRRNIMVPVLNHCELINDSLVDLPSVSKVEEANFKRHSIPDTDHHASYKDRKCNCEHNVQNFRSTKKDIEKENIPFNENNVHMCPCALYNICCPCLNIKNKEVKKSSEQASELLDPFPQQEIPSRPPIKLKQTSNEEGKINQFTQTSVTTKEPSKVQFYDHSNRFFGEKQIPSNSYVEQMSADNMEIISDEVSKIEMEKKIMNREREAQIRGQKALRKERIQKDYEEMLKKLPLLQKKERIAEIRKDKPQYHMSDERLKEAERKRQNDLDNAYNKLFPNLKPAIITLRSKRQEQNNQQVSDITSEQFINIGKWDVDCGEPKIFTAQEVQDIVKAFTGQNPSERRTKLKELLKSLRLHKEQLINEIKLLPKDDSINELINDLNSVDSADYTNTEKTKKKGKNKSERKRRRIDTEKDDPVDNTIDSSFSSSSADENKRHQKSLNRKCQDSKQSNLTTHKKSKKKYKQIIILQNTSTQTSPKITSKPANSESVDKVKIQSKECVKSSDKVCNKLHVPCDCDIADGVKSEELCQIVIKIDEKESPEVIVKSKKKEIAALSDEKPKEFKSVAVGTLMSSSRQEQQKVVIPKDSKIDDKNKGEIRIRPTVIKPRVDTTERTDNNKFNKTKSWREQLSKNSNSTTSTSYLSPPDFQKTKDKIDSDKLSFYNLRTKPQQENIQRPKTFTSEKEQTDNIAFYINKLLSMSKQSIENLDVSSVSSIPTPSQSVIDIESNHPQSDLHNLIKYYANIGDIAQQLDYSRDNESIHYNTSASSSQKSDKKRSEVHTDEVPERDDSIKPQETLLKQYEHITDSCSKRIANLASMIKQIREEKVHMLQTPLGPESSENCICSSPVNSEKDFSTAYMDLPDSKESSNKQSSSSSFDEEEMLKKLMEIDLSLAKKLSKVNQKGDKSGEMHKKRNIFDVTREVVDPNEINQEILSRIERLKQQKVSFSNNKKMESNKGEESTFVPFLSDIPKLPKFEPRSENENSNNQNHKRPPLSKGLIVAKRFNENICSVPHELSTIAEADSQLSAKMPSPNNSIKDIEVIITPKVQETRKEEAAEDNLEKPKPDLQLKDSKNNFKLYTNGKMFSQLVTCEDATCPKLTGESATFYDLTSFESSSDDVDNIEAMLKSIGMEWAIPTLHKTKEALALTSSSSSSSYSAKIKQGNDSSHSNLSLKAFLHKQFLSKVSSSTLISDTSPGSLLSEFSDLSAIHPSSSSAEKSQRKTSTPVTTSKSTSKSREILLCSGGSDISSVKMESDNGSR